MLDDLKHVVYTPPEIKDLEERFVFYSGDSKVSWYYAGNVRFYGTYEYNIYITDPFGDANNVCLVLYFKDRDYSEFHPYKFSEVFNRIQDISENISYDISGIENDNINEFNYSLLNSSPAVMTMTDSGYVGRLMDNTPDSDELDIYKNRVATFMYAWVNRHNWISYEEIKSRISS